MDKPEFMRVMAKLTSYFDNKNLPSETINSYWEILSDLPYKQTVMGIIKTMSTWEQGFIPKPATIRRETLSLTEQAPPLPAEAWSLVREAIRRDIPADKLHPAIQRAVRGMGGLDGIGYAEVPIGVLQSQFMKLYEPVRGDDQTQGVLPNSVKMFIEGAEVKQIGV